MIGPSPYLSTDCTPCTDWGRREVVHTLPLRQLADPHPIDPCCAAQLCHASSEGGVSGDLALNASGTCTTALHLRRFTLACLQSANAPNTFIKGHLRGSTHRHFKRDLWSREEELQTELHRKGAERRVVNCANTGPAQKRVYSNCIQGSRYGRQPLHGRPSSCSNSQLRSFRSFSIFQNQGLANDLDVPRQEPLHHLNWPLLQCLGLRANCSRGQAALHQAKSPCKKHKKMHCKAIASHLRGESNSLETSTERNLWLPSTHARTPTGAHLTGDSEGAEPDPGTRKSLGQISAIPMLRRHIPMPRPVSLAVSPWTLQPQA